MKAYEIEWEGPLNLNEVIDKNDGGKEADNWDGNDYGVYQIYGQHILCCKNTLLYIGRATEQTFSVRFEEHKKNWLDKDQNKEDIKIYLGRIYDPEKHPKDENWGSWDSDVKLAEKILIHKYTPNYNSEYITKAPGISPYKNVRLVHKGKKHRLEDKDNAPDDF